MLTSIIRSCVSRLTSTFSNRGTCPGCGCSYGSGGNGCGCQCHK